MDVKTTIRTEMPKMMEISEIRKEAKGQTSYFFKETFDCKPGQFIMIWLPRVDEKPMAVSYSSKNEFAFTAQKVGPYTTALEKLKKGDKLGIRGPYGSSFSTKKNAVVVAGGVGMSSVSTQIDAQDKATVIYGARSKDHLMYIDRFKKENVLYATDDGSFGHKGFVTDVLREVLEKQKVGVVQTCGPEIMMQKVFELCEEYKVSCEASIERYMSCGFGVCGKCMVDDQIVCLDGPIFESKMLRKLTEFGKFARYRSGRKISLKEYHGGHE